MMEYYVYIYLDPTRPVSIVSNGFHFNYEPFYVGKGVVNHNERSTIHLRYVKAGKFLDKNMVKHNRIKSILDSGVDPIILKLKEGLTNKESLDIEKGLICSLGRKCIDGGLLTNIHEGGSGGDIFTNHPNKEEIRKKLSLKSSGENNPMYGRALKNSLSHIAKLEGRHWNLGRKWDDESKAKCSESSKGSGNPNAKKLDVFDIHGNHLFTFGCIKDAAKYLQIDHVVL